MSERLLRSSQALEEHLKLAAREQLKEQRLRSYQYYWVFGLQLVASLLFGFCLCLFIIYLKLCPKEPEFEVTKVSFASLAVIPATPAQMAAQQKAGTYFAAYFNFNVSCIIRYANPNKHMDILVDHLVLRILYNGFDFGSSKSRSFVQPRESSQLVQINVVQNNMPVPLNVYYTMLQSIKIRRVFGCDLTMKGRLSSLSGIVSPPFVARVRCDLFMENYLITDRHCRRENL